MNSSIQLAGSPFSGVRRGIRRRRPRALPGLTVVELSVVIFSLMLLAFILLTGARAWKRGVDRTNCIVNINAVQKGIRGFSNMSGYTPGDTVPGLEAMVIGPGMFFDSLPACPGDGDYTLGGDQIPLEGNLYMTCSLELSRGHVPSSVVGW
jgi:hypothetical protein